MKPISIENDWNLLYSDFPERYDRFASAPIIEGDDYLGVISKIVSLHDKIVVDVGSGSGLSTFSIAQLAKYAYGVEPEQSMRTIALEEVKNRGIHNIEFIKGYAEKIPLANASADMVTAITLASTYNEENITAFVRDAERIVKPGGYIFCVNIAPKGYGGELYDLIDHDKEELETEDEIRSSTYRKLGYAFIDYWNIKDYQTVQNAIETYGFIFGKKAISFLKDHQKHTIKWSWRIHYKQL